MTFSAIKNETIENFVILVDVSGSMMDSSTTEIVIERITNILNSDFNPGLKFLVVAFNHECKIVSDLSSDKDQILKDVLNFFNDKFFFWGGTDFSGASDFIQDRLNDEGWVLSLITDDLFESDSK